MDREAFEDPFLEKNGTSQLVPLSDEAYEAGMKKIRHTVETAEATGRRDEFRVDLSLMTVTGHVAAAR